MSVDDVYRDDDTGDTHLGSADPGPAYRREPDTVWLAGPGSGPGLGLGLGADTDPVGAARVEPGTTVTADPPAEEGDNLDETPAMIRRHLHARRSGPARRFVLYASGVDTRVLWYAPIDETEFVVQGTLVTLTALVAGLSGLAAASFLVYGHFVLALPTLVVGVAWGMLIFFFDRALVSGTYNAYRFRRREVEALRDADLGSVWAHLLDDSPDRRGMVRRAGEILRVLMVASLRVVLALATSFIAAEMALFLIFQPEINARAAYIEQQNLAQRVAAIQADFKTQSDKRVAERQQLSGASDPTVVRLRAQGATLTKQLADGRHDLEILQAATAAEVDGIAYQAKLSDGTTVKTTGMIGDGAAARSLADRRDTQRQQVDSLSARLTQTTQDLDTRIAQVAKTNAPALKALDTLDNQAAATQQAQIVAASADPGAVKGLLVRQAALNQLINDRDPDTVAPDPVAPCGGLCAVRNWVYPPTPMGPIVVAYRLIFFVIEILPITYKIISSLRRRRPYDAVKAALEEAAVADSIRLADRHLHEASAEMAARAHLRRARAAEMAANRRR